MVRIVVDGHWSKHVHLDTFILVATSKATSQVVNRHAVWFHTYSRLAPPRQMNDYSLQRRQAKRVNHEAVAQKGHSPASSTIPCESIYCSPS